MSSIAIVTGGLAGLGLAGAVAAVATSIGRRPRPYVSVSFAALDATHPQPLRRVLVDGYASFELAVGLSSRGEPCVVTAGGTTPDPAATVTSLVLAPLADAAARMAAAAPVGRPGSHRIPRNRGGQVRPGQSEPIHLYVDLVADDATEAQLAYELLHARLEEYSTLLTRYADGTVQPAAVTVVITGPHRPRHLMAAQLTRYAFCDGSFGDVGSWAVPATLVPVVSEHWAWRFGWDGRDEMPGEERHLLRSAVRAAHADGRRVRLYGFPQRPRRVRRALWRELTAAGVDQFEVADIGSLHDFLGSGSGRIRRAGPPLDSDQYSIVGAQ